MPRFVQVKDQRINADMLTWGQVMYTGEDVVLDLELQSGRMLCIRFAAADDKAAIDALAELMPTGTPIRAGAQVDQPPPRPDATGPDVWLLVLADMEARRQLGIARYGVPLRPDNGRDNLIDAYQEALDLCVYIRSEIEKRGIGTMDPQQTVNPQVLRENIGG